MHKDKYWVLSVVSPQYSQATYFDSNSATPKDYTNVKTVLDNALVGYSCRGGTFKANKRRRNVQCFNHVTQFPCIKQPLDSHRDAYYAIHQIRGFVRDQDQLTLPASLQSWAQKLAEIEDMELRREFIASRTRLRESSNMMSARRGGSSTTAIRRLMWR